MLNNHTLVINVDGGYLDYLGRSSCNATAHHKLIISLLLLRLFRISLLDKVPNEQHILLEVPGSLLCLL